MANHLTFLKLILEIPSFTPTDSTAPPEAFANCARVLDVLTKVARDSGASLIKRLMFEGHDEKYPQPVENLFIKWGRSYGDGKNLLCFLGHIDVVGNLSGWRHAPFGVTEEDGYIYARGATDMKGAVAAFFVAMQRVATENPDCEVCAIITSDEEWAAINGTRRVLHWMKNNGFFPTAFLVGEPASRMRLGDTLAIGRRGSLNGTVRIEGSSGHPAYGETFTNPYRALREIIPALYKAIRPINDNRKARSNLEIMNIVREGGDLNATAVALEVKWNVRFTGNYTAEDIDALVRKAVDACYADSCTITVTSNLQYASKPYNGSHGSQKLRALLDRIIEESTGCVPNITNDGGTSDGRFVQDYFPDAEVLEFGLLVTGGHSTEHPDCGLKGGMHQPDERLAIADYEKLIDIYTATILAQGKAVE